MKRTGGKTAIERMAVFFYNERRLRSWQLREAEAEMEKWKIIVGKKQASETEKL